jgi:hypothetical protein
MVHEFIPDDVQAFLLQRIDSIAQLEALLLLRNNPMLTWDAEALAKRLYTTGQETTAILHHLQANGLLVAAEQSSGVYQYQPASPDLAHMVDRVAELYARYLIPITQLIHTKPLTRVQEFADAFKLKKDE